MKIIKFSYQNMNEVYADHWFEIFPILWDTENFKYVRVEKSEKWGMIDPEEGKIISFSGNPEDFDSVKEIQ